MYQAFGGKHMIEMPEPEFLNRVVAFHNMIMNEFQLEENEQLVLHMKNVMGWKWNIIMTQLSYGNEQLEQLLRTNNLYNKKEVELYGIFERCMNAGEVDLQNFFIYHESQSIHFYQLIINQQRDQITNEKKFRNLQFKSSPILIEPKSPGVIKKKKERRIKDKGSHSTGGKKPASRSLPSVAIKIL